ncbi:MAG: hypothetical protein K2G70_06235 [Turicibacter sp.]|nr:hypothetical protein [Turicibacter sp.]
MMDFQNVNPELFIVIGELLGNVIANELPFNVQNAVGNWLQLVGQAIETYNAQQQYYQQGPGSYFTPDSFNVDNPNNDQSDDSSEDSSSTNTTTAEKKPKKIFPKSSRSTDTEVNEMLLSDEMLQETIEKLMIRMGQLEAEINSLKAMSDKG